jgi:hypothetical protein
LQRIDGRWQIVAGVVNMCSHNGVTWAPDLDAS